MKTIYISNCDYKKIARNPPAGPLTPEGKMQAEALGENMLDLADGNCIVIIHATPARHRETAEIIGKKLCCRVSPETRLNWNRTISDSQNHAIEMAIKTYANGNTDILIVISDEGMVNHLMELSIAEKCGRLPKGIDLSPGHGIMVDESGNTALISAIPR